MLHISDIGYLRHFGTYDVHLTSDISLTHRQPSAIWYLTSCIWRHFDSFHRSFDICHLKSFWQCLSDLRFTSSTWRPFDILYLTFVWHLSFEIHLTSLWLLQSDVHLTLHPNVHMIYYIWSSLDFCLTAAIWCSFVILIPLKVRPIPREKFRFDNICQWNEYGNITY